MGSGTKEFKEEAQGLYQGSSLTAGPGLGERQDGPFSSWRGAGLEGIPPPQTSQFLWVSSDVLASLSSSTLPEAEHH